MSKINGIQFGNGAPFVLIAGPCAMEGKEVCFAVAEKVKEITTKLGIPYFFKASFDKANRSSINSYRGLGMEKGLSILQSVKDKFDLPIVSDIHESDQAGKAAEVLDILQIPAFLCRQTDLLIAAAKTGKPVNVKKGQFLAPWDMKNVIGKLKDSGCQDILLTERGASFGYNNLVVDFRSLAIMREMAPVVFDATHSVQLPGGGGTCSSGQRQFVASLSRAAAAMGIDALFLEVHPDPDKAFCDGPNMVPLNELEELLKTVKEIDDLVKNN